MAPLILGSASPRRAELLRQLGVVFEVRPAAIDETPHIGEAPLAYVRRMAEEKAAALYGQDPRPVLTADTTVILDGASVGKPVDRDEARAMLRRLSGRSHQVCTALCMAVDDDLHRTEVITTVEFAPLDAGLIEAYIDSGEPWDKAGGYGIQGLAGALVRRIDGSYSNVVGLPLCETRELLGVVGVPTALDGQSRP